eukprot:335294_1
MMANVYLTYYLLGSNASLLIILLIILRKEMISRRAIPIADIPIILPRALKYSSLLPISCCIIASLCGIIELLGIYNSSFEICVIGFRLNTIFIYMNGITGGWFGISRLKFCFERKHETQQYGYSKFVFISLKVVLIITMISIITDILSIQSFETEILGCYPSLNGPTSYWGALNIIVLTLISIIVFNLFWYKMRQFAKKNNKNMNNENINNIDPVIHRIYCILQKLFLISLIITFLPVFGLLVVIFLLNTSFILYLYVSITLTYIQIIFISIGVLLQLEHHNDIFEKMVLEWCCWMKCLIPNLYEEIALQQNAVNNQIELNVNDIVSVSSEKTWEENRLPSSPELYKSPSSVTQTNIIVDNK